jgi:hypothetical protein
MDLPEKRSGAPPPAGPAAPQLVIQAPPNARSLNPVGKLGVDTGRSVAADIYSYQRNGTTTANRMFAVLSVGGQSRFYEINPLVGRADQRGTFGEGVIGIALPTG